MNDELHEEVRRLRRSVRLLGTCLAIGLGFVLAAAAQPPSEELTARKLTIVDSEGTARVVIAAPVPDPYVKGKQAKRAGPASGIILNGPDGNERGGYLVTDVGDEGILTLDGLHGGEVFKVVANPDAGASLFIQHSNGAYAGMSTYRGEPELQLVGKGNRRIFAVPADAPELP